MAYFGRIAVVVLVCGRTHAAVTTSFKSERQRRQLEQLCTI